MALRVIKNTINKQTTPEIYTGPHRQLNFQQCWATWLNNPLLNNLYKDNIVYTERWYLELRRLINDESWTHPLLNSVIADHELKMRLIKSTVIDGAVMRSVLLSAEHPEYQLSAAVNLKKLRRWCAFFVSLPDSLEILADLNGQSRD